MDAVCRAIRVPPTHEGSRFLSPVSELMSESQHTDLSYVSFCGTIALCYSVCTQACHGLAGCRLPGTAHTTCQRQALSQWRIEHFTLAFACASRSSRRGAVAPLSFLLLECSRLRLTSMSYEPGDTAHGALAALFLGGET
jgi:hypothetical protein